MWENIILSIRKKFVEIIFSTYFRIFFLLAGFTGLVILRQSVEKFGISIGYLYLILISLAGFWFGIKGGMTTALIASSITLLEMNMFQYWPGRDLAMQGILFRFLAYFIGGLTVGYFSGVEKNLKERLRALVWEDELTGCVNFRWSMQLLENEIDRCRRYRKELTIIMMDIDHFKEMNDRYGHLVGSDILASFASVVRNNVRKIDIVSRYGGDEFLVILPEVGVTQALVVLERIKAKLSQTKVTPLHSKEKIELSIKFSAGVAAYPYNGNDVKELIGIADDVLYKAKREGKDQIAVERRRCVRLRPLTDLKIEVAEEYVEDKEKFIEIANISKRGMLLLFPNDIPREEFLCRIHFPEQDLPSEFTCRIAHKNKSDEDLYRVGVYFVDTPLDFQNRLLNYVESPKAVHLSVN